MKLTPTDRLIMRLVEIEIKNWHELPIEEQRKAIDFVIKKHKIKIIR